MREKKRHFSFYHTYEKDKVERYFEKQAEKGWFLEEIGAFGVETYRRGEPKKVHYAVTFFSKASSFDPEPTDAEERYHDFCAHTGWKVVTTNGALQVFCNEEETPIPIETDAVMEVECAHKLAKKSEIPVYASILIIGILQCGLCYMDWCNSPMEFLLRDSNLYLLFVSVLLIAMGLSEILGYYRWYRKARRLAEEEGIFYQFQGKGHMVLIVSLGILMVSTIIVYVNAFNAYVNFWWILLLVPPYLLIIAIGVCIPRFLKRRGVSARKNKAFFLIVVIVMGIVGGVSELKLLHYIVPKLVPDREPDAYVMVEAEWGSQKIAIYRDEIPLRVEDMTDSKHAYYSSTNDKLESFLISELDAQEMSQTSDDVPGLFYSIIKPKVPFLYEVCHEELLHSYDDMEALDGTPNAYAYRESDGEPWGAEKAYQLYRCGEARTEYLLCYETQIVALSLDWEPTEKQMQIAGEKLSHCEW